MASLARRRVDIDCHRDRTTEARLSFLPGGPRVPALTARAQISVCVPSPPDLLPRPPARGTGRSPERQPDCGHARPPQSLCVEHPAGHIGQRSVSPERPVMPFYMALGLY